MRTPCSLPKPQSRVDVVDFFTPFRVLRAVRTPEGRNLYSQVIRRRLWHYAGRIPGGVSLNCRLEGGLRMRVSSLDQTISKALYLEGKFEQVELAFIRQIVKLGMTAIDAGANIGVHTLTLADCVGPEGTVHAFEPSDAFGRLRQNVALNHFESRTRLHHAALGANEGVLSLVRCTAGYEAFTSRGTPLYKEYAAGEVFEVPMLSLDHYSERAGIERIDFLKIDVEGSEPEVIRGAAGLLARGAIRCVMTEVNEVCLRNCGSSPGDLVKLLRQSGLELRQLEKTGRLTECPDEPTGSWTTVVGRLA